MGTPVQAENAEIDIGSLRFNSATFAVYSATLETQGLNAEKSVGGFQLVNAPHPVKTGAIVTVVVGMKLKASYAVFSAYNPV